MLGRDQPVILQMLEIPDEKAQKALKGVMMELDDCAFSAAAGHGAGVRSRWSRSRTWTWRCSSARARAAPAWSARTCSRRTARSSRRRARRSTGVAKRDVKVLVVGNPANTNCLIAMKNAPSLKPTQFTGMMRLDHNRAVSQIAQKISKPVTSLRKVTVWGNHSATQYPDLFQAEVEWQESLADDQRPGLARADLHPTVQKRGAAIIDARGLSSAASAANAAIDHVRDWISGTRTATG